MNSRTKSGRRLVLEICEWHKKLAERKYQVFIVVNYLGVTATDDFWIEIDIYESKAICRGRYNKNIKSKKYNSFEELIEILDDFNALKIPTI
uniref:Uncharacterized protein n=1 Tax=Marseillevirus LCMAC101 TaxID=2506602 RepID=A0A481YT03_9VIRU|nr:MAG: hypothetical protein LCMAC101_07150 [Marseillevirus LCMAC101]